MSMFRRTGEPASTFPMPPITRFISGGANISGDRAMRLSAVWACVSLIAGAAAMMPLRAYTWDPLGDRVPVAASGFMRNPAAGTTMSEWIEMIVVSLLLRGNAYGLVTLRDGNGTPVSVEILNPDVVSVERDRKTGILMYKVNGHLVETADVLHIRGMRMPGSDVGMSPVAYAAATLETAQAARDFGRGFFKADAHPTGILTSESSVNQPLAEQIKDRFKNAVSGRDIAVLGAGVKYSAIQVSPTDSQFLETQRFSATQIASLYKVPPSFVGGSQGGGSITYANVTQRSLDLLTYAVQPILTRLEQAIYPLLPNVKHVQFDTNALVRMTPVDKWNVYAKQLALGAATINEVRSEEGREAVDWGYEPWMPSLNTSSAQTALTNEIQQESPSTEPNSESEQP